MERERGEEREVEGGVMNREGGRYWDRGRGVWTGGWGSNESLTCTPPRGLLLVVVCVCWCVCWYCTTDDFSLVIILTSLP